MSGKAAKADRRRLRQEMAAARSDTPYWHGGPDGLAVGTILKPLTELLHIPSDTRLPIPSLEDLQHNYVCITPSRSLARDFAAHWSRDENTAMAQALTGRAVDLWQSAPRDFGGTLYRVQPLGPVTEDPDYQGVSFRTPRARILAVEEAGIEHSDKPSPENLRYITWETGERMWSDEGHALPDADMRLHGITAEDLRSLGYAPNHIEIRQHVTRVLRERHIRP